MKHRENNRRTPWLRVFLVVVGLGVLVLPRVTLAVTKEQELAQLGPQQAKPLAASPAKESPVSIESPSPVQGDGLELAEQHLPELMPVLKHLRGQMPGQYEKAIRDLDRAAKKLDAIKRRDQRLHEIALQEWQLRGQIDLLKAKYRVKKSEPQQKQILEKLKTLQRVESQRLEREIALLEDRRAAHEERRKQVTQLIERSEALRQQLVEQRQQLLAEPVNENSPVYLRAIGKQKSESPRDPTFSSPKQKRQPNE